jgi:hypothetical protein
MARLIAQRSWTGSAAMPVGRVGLP